MEHFRTAWKDGTPHHAYFFVGDRSLVGQVLIPFFSDELSCAVHGNPDFIHEQYDTFSIDEARRLALWSERKNLTGRQFFLIEANYITEEAQNALLKALEEPREHTHFFLVLPQDTLLPTLKSRMQCIVFDEVVGDREEKNILELSLAKRLEYVKALTEDISDEEKTKQHAIELVQSIERVLYARGVLLAHAELTACEAARSALLLRGAPVKMILEELMLEV